MLYNPQTSKFQNNSKNSLFDYLFIYLCLWCISPEPSLSLYSHMPVKRLIISSSLTPALYHSRLKLTCSTKSFNHRLLIPPIGLTLRTCCCFYFICSFISIFVSVFISSLVCVMRSCGRRSRLIVVFWTYSLAPTESHATDISLSNKTISTCTQCWGVHL